MATCTRPNDRLFTVGDTDRLDELGFLDLGRTPWLLRVGQILDEPIAWVIGPPWIGKTTLAMTIEDSQEKEPDSSGANKRRWHLTRLGLPNADTETPPPWWDNWSKEKAVSRAVWLIDGVDEGVERNGHLLRAILRVIDDLKADHRTELRLVLFSRPSAEVVNFRDELLRRYAGTSQKYNSPIFWLARLDREAAKNLVGVDHFPYVADVIRRNDLQSVAGYPIVLKYVAQYRETANLTVAEVWRGIVEALLGERQTNQRARFTTEAKERFNAAIRIAAVLTLTGQQTIREYSPSSDVSTIGTLFQQPDNRLLTAARDACQTAAFTELPEQKAFSLSKHNVQDWLTAFALQQLPLPALRTVLANGDGELTAGLREPARLIRTITDSVKVRAEIDRLAGGILLPSDATEPTLAEAIQHLNKLESLAGDSPWGLRLGSDSQKELVRLRVDGLESLFAERLRDPSRQAQVKRFLLDVAEAIEASEAVDPAIELVTDATQNDELRLDAMLFVARCGGSAHLGQLESPFGEREDNSEIDNRLRGVLILELLNRMIWPTWHAALHAPAVGRKVVDSRIRLLDQVAEKMTIEDARKVLPHLRKLYDRHADYEDRDQLPKFLRRAIELVTRVVPQEPQDVDLLTRFALELTKDTFSYSTACDIAGQLRPTASARQRFYQHDIEASRDGHDDRRIAALWLLVPDDWQWLRDQGLGPWAGIRRVWDDVYWLARRARDEKRLTDSEWQDLVLLVEQQVPGLAAQYEEGVTCCCPEWAGRRGAT